MGFSDIYQIIGSQCTLAPLRKDSNASGEFMGNRMAEILDTTKIEPWYNVKSKDNISDNGTRSTVSVIDISEYSEYEPWPVSQDIHSCSNQYLLDHSSILNRKEHEYWRMLKINRRFHYLQ